MYVAGFGGSWFNHPFWRPNFLLSSKRDLDRVSTAAVPYVLIDEKMGKPASTAFAPAKLPDPQTPAAPERVGRRRKRAQFHSIDPHHKEALAQRRAGALVARTKVKMQRMFSDLQLGWALERADVDGVLDDVVQAIDEDAKALLSVLRLKTKDDYTYLHSVAVCTLMICVGRRRGLSKEEIRDLGLAGLLHDVGKVGIPDDVLNKPGRLTDPEFDIVRNHPEHGYRILAKSGEISETALDVCRHHHEKMDGTGYPHGLAAEEISIAARLGAVCDVFDALTSRRAYKAPWTPQRALTRMWGWEGHFDRELMADLMIALHIFAEGLLVRLSDDRLAITLREENHRRGVPVVAFHSAREKRPLDPVQVTIREDDMALRILSVEEPGDWGFDDWEAIKARLMEAT